MESDVDEKIFPEGASELRRTGSIIERRARRNLRAARRQFSLPQTSDMCFSLRERKNVSIKNGILNCRRIKHSTLSLKVLMIDMRGYRCSKYARFIKITCELREFSDLGFAQFNFRLSEQSGIVTL